MTTIDTTREPTPAEAAVDAPTRVIAPFGRPAWKRILGTVDNYADLQPELLGRVEELIDFVTAPSS